MSVDVIHHCWPDDCPASLIGKADLVFADPPYNYRVTYEDDATGDNLPSSEYKALMSRTMRECHRMLRPGGQLWWLCPAEDGVWVSGLLAGKLLFGRPVIFYERFSQYQTRQMTKDYRLLFPAVKPGTGCVTFDGDAIREPSVRQLMGDKRADPRGRVPGHVWTVRRLQGTSKDRVPWHPAQLAPEPLERIVLGFTRPGDLVVDAFAGSGNMGLACIKHGRSYVGLEASNTYCELIRERLR